jgi:hypothetical protein
MDNSYVQFGCGLCAPLGWRNFDASPTLWIQKRLALFKLVPVKAGFANFPDNVEYGDIVKGLPVSPGSLTGVYCSHVLEHLTLQECRSALRNVFSYLRPGGYFRIVLPDLEYMIQNYVVDPQPDAAHRFIEATVMGAETPTRGTAARIREALGHSQHKWLWDHKSLAKALEDAGFAEIRRASYGDSPDKKFLEVEDPERWTNNLGMECRRG